MDLRRSLRDRVVGQAGPGAGYHAGTLEVGGAAHGRGPCGVSAGSTGVSHIVAGWPIACMSEQALSN